MLLSSGGSGTLFVSENMVRTMCECLKVGAPAHSYNACNAQRRAVAALGTTVIQRHFLQCQCFLFFFSCPLHSLCIIEAMKSNDSLYSTIEYLSRFFFDSHLFVSLFLFLCVGEPVQCTAWLGQCILYILIMMFEKVLIMLVLLIPQWKKVSNYSERKPVKSAPLMYH